MKKSLLIFLLLSLPCISSLHAQIITTLAGNGISGHAGDGGPATAAKLIDPFGVAVDKRGNVYVAEYGNYVRKIDHFGIITTIAGNGSVAGPLGDGGPATAAFLDNITDLAFDVNDNLYVVDHGNSRIRKIDPSGIITTVAGGGTGLSDGMPATDAKLSGLTGITVDPAGNIYVCINVKVRKINTSGTIITVAGNGTSGYAGDGGLAINASITESYDVAVDKAGNIYFTDWHDYSVRKVTVSTGKISTIAGTGGGLGGYIGDGGPATAAFFNSPWGIAIDDNDNIYICDAYNNCVREIYKTTGIINTVAGNGWTGTAGDGGPATAAACGSRNVAVDCGGNLFLTNYLLTRKVTYIHNPEFVKSDSVITCQNYTLAPVDTQLRATDIDHSLSVDWTVDVAPAHGTISGSGASATTTGSIIDPSGITYTPTPGYSGIDSFTMQVAYCSQIADWHTVYVRVKPSPVVAAVTAPDTLCNGLSFVPTNTTSGGVWSMSNTITAVMTSGNILGMVAGIDTVYYTVTGSNACSTAVARKLTVIDCPVGVKTLAAATSEISVYPNPAGMQVNVDGLKAAAHYKLLSVVGATMSEGTLTTSKNTISLSGIADGMYMLEVADPASGLTITKKIIKGQ